MPVTSRSARSRAASGKADIPRSRRAPRSRRCSLFQRRLIDAPALESWRQSCGTLGDRHHPRAHVFAPLRVVGGSREQRRRPIALPLAIALVKFVDADPEMLRLAADFVQRGQPVVNVERRILQALRHDRPGALLEFQNEMRVLGARFLVQIFRKTEEQNVAQKIEDRFFDARDCAASPQRPRARSPRDPPRSPVRPGAR